MEPTDLEFESQAVLNPSCLQDGNTVHLFYRAVRKGNYSSIGYARLEGPLTVVERSTEPVLTMTTPEDSHGVEDPRVVLFEGQYHMFYTAFDGATASIGLATSADMKTWTKQGIISPRMRYAEAAKIFRTQELDQPYSDAAEYLQKTWGTDIRVWDKDGMILPRRVNEKIVFIHRIVPSIQIALIDSLDQLKSDDFWKSYLQNLNDHVIAKSESVFEYVKIGAGAVPIETDKGWLMLCHGVEGEGPHTGTGVYHASVLLLDKANPRKVVARLTQPLFSPVESWERSGDVNNVVFPTGTAVFDGRLYIYYGAADSRIAVASVDLDALLDDLTKKK